jgi:RNA polymerase sigma factor (TIGR02999 family)
VGSQTRTFMSELTQILQAVERGEENSSQRLLPLVYDELRRLAAIKMSRESENQTLQPTALVHEAWLRLAAAEEVHWQNRGHFFAAAAEAMRRILIERARRRSRLKHGGGQQRLDIQELPLPVTTPDEKALLINEALERLQAEDQEKARVVVMKFFGGLTNREVAQSLNVTERTVERQWAYAKVWLFRTVKREL